MRVAREPARTAQPGGLEVLQQKTGGTVRRRRSWTKRRNLRPGSGARHQFLNKGDGPRADAPTGSSPAKCCRRLATGPST
jgi:hypothetical protein